MAEAWFGPFPFSFVAQMGKSNSGGGGSRTFHFIRNVMHYCPCASSIFLVSYTEPPSIISKCLITTSFAPRTAGSLHQANSTSSIAASTTRRLNEQHRFRTELAQG